MKFTRAQELKLIEIGLHQIVNELTREKQVYKSRKKKWTTQQHKKFASTMAKKWKEKQES